MAKLGYTAARAALAAGDRLMITHPDPNKASDKVVYGLVVSGKAIGALAYRKLREDLVPVSDGLFGEDLAQTFRLSDA